MYAFIHPHTHIQFRWLLAVAIYVNINATQHRLLYDFRFNIFPLVSVCSQLRLINNYMRMKYMYFLFSVYILPKIMICFMKFYARLNASTTYRILRFGIIIFQFRNIFQLLYACFLNTYMNIYWAFSIFIAIFAMIKSLV